MPKSKRPIIIDGDLYRIRRGKLVKVPEKFANRQEHHARYVFDPDTNKVEKIEVEWESLGGGHTHDQTIRKRPSKYLHKDRKVIKNGGFQRFPKPAERVDVGD